MEAKDVLELIGFKAEEGKDFTAEDVSKHINKSFIHVGQIENRRDIIDPIINKAVGSRIGKLETATIKWAKDLGVEVTHGEFDGQKIEDVQESVFTKIKAVIDAKPKDTVDVKAWESKLDKVRAESDTFKNSLTDFQKKYSDLETSIVTEKTEAVKNAALQTGLSTIKWPNGTTDITKEGFKAIFHNTYGLLPEKDAVYVTAKTGENIGNRVQHPKKLDELMKVSEAMEFLAREKGLWTDSPHEGKPASRPPATSTQQRQPNPNRRERMANPAFFGTKPA